MAFDVVKINPGETETEAFLWPGGDGYCLCDFVQGPGMLILQVKSPSPKKTNVPQRWIDSDVVFDSDERGVGIKHFKLPRSVEIRLILVGDLPPFTELTATIVPDFRKSLYA